MVGILLVDRAGTAYALDIAEDHTLMEGIRAAGYDELLALCGGCCACATCHVYVDESYMDRLPPVSEDESDLLDSSEHRRPNSRLACQVKADSALDGATITIVAE